MTATLAIDVGQTGSRLRLSTGDAWESASLRAGSEPEDVLVTTVLAAAARLPQIDTLAAGLTGLQGRAGRAAEVLERVCEAVTVRRVVLADDALTSYLGALGLRPGVVVAAGTGAVTLATDGASRHGRVDGWGYLVGDLGSGYWIGRRGLESALRELDGRGGSAALLRLARDSFGDVERLPQQLAGDGERVSRVALFAASVADAARAGDAAAAQIWAEAGAHLAESVAAAATRAGLSGEVAVSWTGRLFDAGPLLLEPFRAALPPHAVIKPAGGDGLDGARLLSELTTLPALEPLIVSALRETIRS